MIRYLWHTTYCFVKLPTEELRAFAGHTILYHVCGILKTQYTYHVKVAVGSPASMLHVNTASSGETTTQSCKPLITSGAVPTVQRTYPYQ